MAPQDHVTIDATVVVTETERIERGRVTHEHTEQRTFRFPIEDYSDLRAATMRDAVDILDHYVEDANTYSHSDGSGWAIDVGENITVKESLSHSIRAQASAPSVYMYAQQEADDPTGVFDKINTIAKAERPVPGAAEALLTLIHGNTGVLDRKEMDEQWETPNNFYKLTD